MNALMQSLFERQATHAPGRTALKVGSTVLSYAELDRRATLIAQALRSRGVGRGQRVGLCVERGADMLAAVLGILKAGAAYVPLDSAFPQERLRFMAEDAQLALLVSTSALAGSFGLPRERQLLLDTDAAALASQSDQRLTPDAARDARPEDPAYVIYTSGSTGKPKGVVIPHRAVVNFLTSMAREPGLASDDVLVAVTTLSFDIAVLELQLPLSLGAMVVIASRDEAIDGRALGALLEQHRATVMQATPVTWRLLLEAGWKAGKDFKALVGGEGLPKDLAAQLIASGIELWNMYGPTETTVWSTCCRVREAEDIHIGRPIDNTEICILDEQGQPVPAGAVGELLIGGAGLALGYFNRPDLTAEKFIAHPLKSGAQLYRTGDLARYRPDGNIDCLGRIDFQVKIRGYRIELGEIEALLSQHPKVKESVVTAYEDMPGEKRLVAYVVTQGPDTIDPDQLRELLRSRLPEYMVPATFVDLEKIPRTPNGKIDRKALPEPMAEANKAAPASIPAGTPLEEAIAAIWREVLGVTSVGWRTNFFDLGGHSLLVGRVHTKLKNLLNRDVSIVELYQHPTISKLAAHLSAEQGQPKSSGPVTMARTLVAGDSVAIVGMAGRFPGANDLSEFWSNLRDGVESISFFSDEELRAAGVPVELIANPSYVRAKSIVDKIDHFDARVFGYSPREATLIDPQQRIFLESAWAALEDAGYAPDQYPGSIGVYAGASPNLYMFQVLAAQNDSLLGYGFPLTIHQEKDYLATRVSYELNLRGPSVSIQTACSTSLVAVHMACRSLLGGECDMALAGAVSAQVPQNSGYLYQEGGIGSRDGHCRVFDGEASGTVFGNGVGIVVLKRLSDAVRDGDNIRAVIKSTAINNDGSGKAGFTAPSVEGQAEVIAMAHRTAQIDADQITYVEAHGTGTVVGDPIEITALTKAFRATTNRTGYCAVGSVKSNIGHLDAAAGMAGLIKTVLALEHRQIPPTLNFLLPNPSIDFAHSPFCVSTKLAEWKCDGPRRAGVSSFGVGGTNSHVVLEEAPERPAIQSAPSSVPSPKLLVFSAGTSSALGAIVSNFREHLRTVPTTDLADAAFTLQAGRRALEWRQAFVCEDRDEALRLLDPARRPAHSRSEQGSSKIVFMFTGQGSQYAGMGADLYLKEPLFKSVVDECLELIRPHVEMDLRGILWPGTNQADSSTINQTACTQPLLFIIEYALARLWMNWGVEPYVMIGHSIGEYVAAHLAGVIPLQDALRLVAKRGRLMQGLPPGSMLAVPASHQQVEAWLNRPEWNGKLSLAAANAPELSVVSGPTDEIKKFETALAEQGQSTRLLHTSHAFHSSMMDSILDEFTAAVAEVKLRPPRIPYISNLTGTWLTDAQATDPAYYAKHLRCAVRFSDGIREIAREIAPTFLEIGPGQTLKSLVKLHAFEGGDPAAVLHSLPGATEKQSDSRVMLSTLGLLWCKGRSIDWTNFNGERPARRIPLPTYPFERQRYSVDAGALVKSPPRVPQGKRPINEWFYAPGWRSALPVAVDSRKTSGDRQVCIVFRGSHPFHDKLTDRIRRLGYQVFEVFAAQGFRPVGAGSFEIDPAEPADYSRLLDDLKRKGTSPNLVVHLWGLGQHVSDRGSQSADDLALGLGFFPLVFLAQAFGALDISTPVDIKVLIDGSTDVVDEAVARPENAVAIGPCIVIPQEFDNITCACVDVDLSFASPAGENRLLDQLVGEVSLKSVDPLVAYRGKYRWTKTYDSYRLPALPEQPAVLKQGGAYLITGGLGGVGLELADYLGKTVQAKLILLGRTPLPGKDGWTAWLSGHAADDQTSRKISRLQQIESYGAEVFVCSADVSDREQMKAAVRSATERFGPINGVIHAAGVPGGGAIHVKSHEAAMAVLRAKVHGTRVLAEVLSDQQPDFMILCSSVNAVVGGFGQVDYCAANAFLDAFAHFHKARTGMTTVSINWDMWSEVGMAQDTSVPKHLQEQRAIDLKHGITAREGQDVFARLLGCGLPQVLVSTREFTEMQLRRPRVESNVGESAPAPVEGRGAGHPRPDLNTAYVAPADEIERLVTGIWQQALGIDEVGVNDNFFELGGDSLLAVQVVGRIRQAMSISLPVAMFYADPTVASLKKHLLGSGTVASERETPEARREARQGLGLRAQRRRGFESRGDR